MSQQSKRDAGLDMNNVYNELSDVVEKNTREIKHFMLIA